MGGTGLLGGVALSGFTLNKVNGNNNKINEKIENFETKNKGEIDKKLEELFNKYDSKVKQFEKDLEEEKRMRTENYNKLLSTDPKSFIEKFKKQEEISEIFQDFLKDFKKWQNSRHCVSAVANGKNITGVLPRVCDKIWKKDSSV